MKTIKKIFQSISLLLILALLCSTPVYAKTSDKGKIEKVTTAYFKAVKNYNKNGIKWMLIFRIFIDIITHVKKTKPYINGNKILIM